VVSSRDSEVLTGCASQNSVFDGSEAQVSVLRGRSTPVRVGQVLEEDEARTGRLVDGVCTRVSRLRLKFKVRRST
jgi:hypothetical protein